MNVVFDTNILSTFAKINRLDLLVKLFDKQKLLIPTMVFKELQDSKQEFTQTVLDNKSFEKVNSTKEEKIINEKELEKLIERNRNKRQNKDKKQRRFYRLTLIQSCLVASIRNSGVKISVVCCGGCPNLAFFNVC